MLLRLDTAVGDQPHIVSYNRMFLNGNLHRPVCSSFSRTVGQCRSPELVPSYSPELQSRVTVPSYSPELQSRVTVQSYSPELQSRVTVQSYSPELQSRVTVQSYSPGFQYTVSVRSYSLAQQHVCLVWQIVIVYVWAIQIKFKLIKVKHGSAFFFHSLTITSLEF